MHTRLLSIDHADADLSVDLAHLRTLLARAYHSPSAQGVVRQTQSGYVGTNPSGNATSRAPAAAASFVSVPTFSIVASRSRNTGAACTAATSVVGAGFVMPFTIARPLTLRYHGGSVGPSGLSSGDPGRPP